MTAVAEFEPLRRGGVLDLLADFELEWVAGLDWNQWLLSLEYAACLFMQSLY